MTMPHPILHEYIQFSSRGEGWGHTVACSEPWFLTPQNISGTRLGCLSEIWITLLSKLIDYGRHCCKLGAQWPEKGWGPCTKHASTNDGRDGRQGRWYTISTRISKDPINYNIPWKFQFNSRYSSLIWWDYFRNVPRWWSIKISYFPLA